MFTQQEITRYHRQVILPEMGMEGQQKLKNATVLVIGAGGLGCPVLQYLSAAGIGTIGIVDDDIVDESNLHRQIIYNISDIGKPKAAIAAEKLFLQNPHIKFNFFQNRLTKENALAVINDYDIVVDCSDNFPTRYLVNDACVILKKSLVFGSVYKFEGQVSVFNYKQGPTYRCLFPDPPAEAFNCSDIGVIGVLPGIIGTLQANEVIKMITGIGMVFSGKLLIIDALSLSFNTISFTRTEENTKMDKLQDYDGLCEMEKENESMIKQITVLELKNKLDKNEDLQIIDVRELYEYEICNLNGELIPLGEVSQNLHKIAVKKQVIVYCHHGTRSAIAIKYIQENTSFSNLYNLTGGIHTWAKEIDHSMKQY